MSLAVRNGSMASLYALRGQVSWSCWRRDADERCGHGRRPDGCQAEGIVAVLVLVLWFCVDPVVNGCSSGAGDESEKRSKADSLE